MQTVEEATWAFVGSGQVDEGEGDEENTEGEDEGDGAIGGEGKTTARALRVRARE